MAGMIRKVLDIIKGIAALILYPIAYPFHLHYDDKDVEKALDALNAYSADPANTCIRQNKLCIEPLYDLELIIPCYNVEKYVEGCIRSVMSQKTKYKIHCMIVDDGSTDRTGEILDTFGSDSRVTIIHQQNKGHAGARNTALQEIRAKYITFLDSDDELYEGSLDPMIEIAETKDADIVQGGFERFTETGVFEKYTLPTGPIGKDKLQGYTCGKLLRATLFENVEFPCDYLFEDSVMRQIVFGMCDPNKIYGADVPFYRYRFNLKSITRTSLRSRRSLDSFWITRQLYADRQKLGLATDDAYYAYILSMAVTTYRRIRNQPAEIKKACFIAYSDFVARNFASGWNISASNRALEKTMQNKQYRLFQVLTMTRK